MQDAGRRTKAARSGPTRVLGRVERLPLRCGAGVQDTRALHPGAHRAQAGGQQRLLFQVEPTAGQSVLCGEHTDPQFVGAPHCQGSRPAEAMDVSVQPDPTAPGASRSAALHGVQEPLCMLASRVLSQRKRVPGRRRCPLPSRGAGRGDGGIPPRPERR